MKVAHRLAALLCLGGLLAAPAAADATTTTQRVDGFAIGWPATLSAVAPGDVVRVSLAPSRTAAGRRRVAVVSLVRVAHSGRPMAVVARRRMRRGTFAARVPAPPGARYRLSVAIGRTRAFRDFTAEAASAPVPAPAPSPPAEPPAPVRCAPADEVQGTLAVTPTTARPGESLRLTLTNTGSTCLQAGLSGSWQLNRDGTWVEIPLNRPVPAVLALVQPGATLAEEFVVPEDALPGEYRIVKRFDGGSRPGVEAAATVIVTA